MSIVAWIVGAVLAVAFFASGAMKVIQSREKLLDRGTGGPRTSRDLRSD